MTTPERDSARVVDSRPVYVTSGAFPRRERPPHANYLQATRTRADERYRAALEWAESRNVDESRGEIHPRFPVLTSGAWHRTRGIIKGPVREGSPPIWAFASSVYQFLAHAGQHMACCQAEPSAARKGGAPGAQPSLGCSKGAVFLLDPGRTRRLRGSGTHNPSGSCVRMKASQREASAARKAALQDPETTYLTIRQTAERFQVSERTVARWVADGRLRSTKAKAGRARRIPLAALREFSAPAA